MHETCWGVGVAMPRATAGVSREGLGETSLVVVVRAGMRAVSQTVGAIDELPALLCAHTRGLCYSRDVGTAAAQRCRVPKRADYADATSGGLAGLVRLPCAQACGLCLNAD